MIIEDQVKINEKDVELDFNEQEEYDVNQDGVFTTKGYKLTLAKSLGLNLEVLAKNSDKVNDMNVIEQFLERTSIEKNQK
jgi:hypothetical protein